MPGLTRTTRDTDAPETTTSTASGPASAVPEQDTLGNSAMADIIREKNTYAGEQELNPNLTGIIHIGMNEYARDEANALNQANRRHGGAKSIRDQEEQDTLVRGGRKYRFESEEDCALFAASLGVRPEQALKAAEILHGGGQYAKDELAQIVEVYADADLGLRKMDRVVFSGHSVGDQIWGDNNGEIPFETFAALRVVFPKAASQVKHLMLSACYGGGEANMQQFFQSFPNLESIWAYSGSSPGTWSGAIDHTKRWEDATDEDGDASLVDPERAEGLRKAKNVATWNVEDGYQGDQPVDISELEFDLATQDNVYERYFSGQAAVTNSQTGELRDYYNLIQRYLAHPEAAPAMVAQMRERRDQVIRLLYWNVVSPKFQNAYKGRLQEAYAATGRTLPDFGRLSRGAALAEIEAFAAAAAGGNAAALEGLRLLQGLRDLSPEVVLTTWV